MMKRQPMLVAILAAALLLPLMAQPNWAQGVAPSSAVGTEFTYQGFLTDGGSAAAGTYDLRFLLYDAAVGGTQVGSSVHLEDVVIIDGLFTVQLDFGLAAFAGEERWLEIGVRPGDSTAAFTGLSPRQPLTATPYALYALSAPWSGLASVPAGFADGIDDDTTYGDGAGLLLAGTTFSADTAYLQRRVDPGCPTGSAIRTIGSDGTAACQAMGDGDITAVNAGTGLVGGGDSGDVSLALDTSYTDGHYWRLTGNGSTMPSAHFLGTTDAVSLTLAVSSTAALRLEPNDISPNLIGGSAANEVGDGVVGAVIGGGGSVGKGHRVTNDYGTIGGGENNQVGSDEWGFGSHATVGGGGWNVASGQLSTISGGDVNRATAQETTVGGGYGNKATDSFATVSGGFANEAGAQYAVAGGGECNIASGSWATVAGGRRNRADESYAAVGGGQSNAATGSHATVAGGDSNQAAGTHAAVGGGDSNQATGAEATVGGGGSNQATGAGATVSGGESNQASGSSASLGGGSSNQAAGSHATVSGGASNTASGNHAAIGGGDNNAASHSGATVAGGGYNSAASNWAVVGGGLDNEASGEGCTVAGGMSNVADSDTATVGGGYGNQATGGSATAAGGYGNAASSANATVGGGRQNLADQPNATVSGGLNNEASGWAAAVGGGTSNQASGERASVSGGDSNQASGVGAAVGGGAQNQAIARYATVAGGGPSDPASPSTTNNRVTDEYGTVGGGGHNRVGDGDANLLSATYATVGGGKQNTASAEGSTVAGGQGNQATGVESAVSGGYSNSASGLSSAIGGGRENDADGSYSTVGGGFSNNASGRQATVPGGVANEARGDYSFAAGRNAQANHDGAFVWADSRNSNFYSTRADQFLVRAEGGVKMVMGASTLSDNYAALQVENYTIGGEAAWFRQVSSSNTLPVLKLLKNPDSPSSFLMGRTRSPSGVEVTKFWIDSTGTYHGPADFAEALPVAGDGELEEGDVLVVSTVEPGKVERSTQAYDGTVIGVYSSGPGFVGHSETGAQASGFHEIPVAVLGIVPAKATAENGPIRPGDLLTTSSTPGHAMRCKGLERCFGRTIGKALEPLNESSGVIRMLVSLQ